MNVLIHLLHEPSLQRLGWVLIHFLWEGTGIGLAAAAALRALRGASAQVRYTLLCIALLACAVAPAITWAELAKETAPPNPEGVFAENAPAKMATENAALPAETRNGMATPLKKMPGSWRTPVLHMLDRFAPYAVSLWLAGVMLLTARLGLGWMQLRRIRRSGAAIADPAWQERLCALAKRMGIGTQVRLLKSALVEVPTLIGLLRPVILLPASVFTGLTPRQLEAILAHELAHVRRYDYLVNFFQTAIETVLFYHPAVWWIGRKLREERENCCDDIAVETMRDRVIYASALVTLEESRAAFPPQFAMAASGASLLGRIRRIAGVDRRKGGLAPVIAMVLIAGSVLAPLGGRLALGQDSKQAEATPADGLRPSVETQTAPPEQKGDAPAPSDTGKSFPEGLPAKDPDDAATIDVLTTGYWHIVGKKWANDFTFKRDHTVVERHSVQTNPLSWTVSDNEILIKFDNFNDVLFLPLDPKGTKGLSADGTESIATRIETTLEGDAGGSGASGPNGANAPAAHPVPPAANTVGDLRKAIAAFPYTWEHEKTNYNIEFYADGSGNAPKNPFTWRAVNAHEVDITWLKKNGDPDGDTTHLTFSRDYSSYTGTSYSKHTFAVWGHQAGNAGGNIALTERSFSAAPQNKEPDKSAIDIIAETGPMTTENVLEQLDAKQLPQVRINIIALREKLLDEAAKAPASSPDTYEAAVGLCNAWLAALDERDSTMAAESKAPPMGTADMASTRPVHPGEFSLEQEGIDAQKKKQDDKTQNAFFSTAQKHQWAQRCAELHQYLDRLYAQIGVLRRHADQVKASATPAS